MPDPNQPIDPTQTADPTTPVSPAGGAGAMPPVEEITIPTLNTPPTDAPQPPPVPPAPAEASSAPPPDLPPVVPPVITPPPAKKFGGRRIIATILGLLVLGGGLTAGLILVRQQQLFRQKAAEFCGDCTDDSQCGEGSRCGPGGCCIAVNPPPQGCQSSADCSPGEICKGGQCTGPATPPPPPPAAPPCKVCRSGSCTINDVAGCSESNNECLSDVECPQPPPSVCSSSSDSTCIGKGSGASCTVTGGGSGTCQISSGGSCVCQPTAVSGTCSADSDSQCVGKTTGASCTVVGGGSGKCQGSAAGSCVCQSGCQSNADCSTGQVCSVGVCWGGGGGGCPAGYTTKDEIYTEATTCEETYPGQGTIQIAVNNHYGGICCLPPTAGTPLPNISTQRGGGTPPPGTPPPEQTAAQCLNIRAFDTNWSQLTSTQLAALKAGDKVRFTVQGATLSGTFDKARFTINGVLRPEVTTTRPGTTEFYDEYTIPEGTSSFSVNAQLHHSTLGWF